MGAYLLSPFSICAHEAPIKYFSRRKGSTQTLGVLRVDTSIEPRILTSFDESSFIEASELPDEGNSGVTTIYSKRSIHHIVSCVLQIGNFSRFF